jgi:hypothetical protein
MLLINCKTPLIERHVPSSEFVGKKCVS